MAVTDERSPSRGELERRLRECLARMRLANLDFKLRVEAGELLVALGDRPRGIRVLRSCADYFTLAGFPLRALWAIKLLQRHDAEAAVVDRGLNLLARHYARTESSRWGEPIFEMSLSRSGELDLSGLPESLDEVVSEVDRRATDIIRGVNFPDRLPKLPLISELGPDAFLTVAKAMQLRRVQDGVMLVEEGDAGRAAHIVVTGSVRIVKRGDNGRSIELARLAEGEVFGEMALITQSPRVASAVADGEVDVFELPATVLDRLGVEAASLQSALSRHVCDRMVTNLMKLSEVFKVLPMERRDDLLARFQSRLLEPDEKVIVEGQEGRGLYVILDGQVQVSKRKDGHTHVLNYLRVGDLFGEISLIRDTPATATCTATRRTMLMYLSKESFNELTRVYPEMKRRIDELGEFRLLDSLYTLA